MGGANSIIKKGKELFDQGKYLYAVEILNKLVYAEPKNQIAKDLLADCYEQIGYQKESPSVRNSFLAGAYELRNGIPQGASPKGTGPDMIKAMGVNLWLDFLGIRVNSKKAEGMHFVINLILPDINEKYIVEMSNATLTNIQGFQSPNPDLTLTVNRNDLSLIMMGVKSFDDLIASGIVQAKGDTKIISQLASVLDQFEIGFEILPGTISKQTDQPKNPSFKQDQPAVIGAD